MKEQQKIEFLDAVTDIVARGIRHPVEQGFYETTANAYDTREHIKMASYHDEAGEAIGATINVSDVRINSYGNGEEVIEDFTVCLDRSSGNYCDEPVGEVITSRVDIGRLPGEPRMQPIGYRVQQNGTERSGLMTEQRLTRAHYLLGVLASRGSVVQEDY